LLNLTPGPQAHPLRLSQDLIVQLSKYSYHHSLLPSKLYSSLFNNKLHPREFPMLLYRWTNLNLILWIGEGLEML